MIRDTVVPLQAAITRTRRISSRSRDMVSGSVVALLGGTLSGCGVSGEPSEPVSSEACRSASSGVSGVPALRSSVFPEVRDPGGVAVLVLEFDGGARRVAFVMLVRRGGPRSFNPISTKNALTACWCAALLSGCTGAPEKVPARRTKCSECHH